MHHAFRLAVLVVILAPLHAAAGSPRDRSCTAQLGAKRAAELRRECLEVSTAARPPCNAQNGCETIRSEIRRGCEALGADAPPVCERHVDIDDDEED